MLMYERAHVPFKAPDSGMIGPGTRSQVGGAVSQSSGPESSGARTGGEGFRRFCLVSQIKRLTRSGKSKAAALSYGWPMMIDFLTGPVLVLLTATLPVFATVLLAER